MAYPTNIDQFTDKLNKKQAGVYVVEEELTVTGGKYDGMLIHDNIITSTIRVYTGPKLTGTPVTNYVVSLSDETPWKRYIKIFTDAPRVYVTYETTGDTVEADDVNTLQSSITATQAEVERYKTANDNLVTDARTRLATVETKKADKTYVDTQFLGKADKVNTYTKTETDQRIQTIVGAAPGALDTLQELGAALNNDPNFAATVTNQLAGKVDKVTGKGLSTEDFTSTEKSKLAGIAAGANNYVHPANHPPAIITQDANNRFVSDTEKATWNGKVEKTIHITSGIDLNTVINSGFYRLGSSHPNCPVAAVYGQLIVSRGVDTIFQLATGFSNNEFYVRHGNPTNVGGTGVWQPWQRLYHAGNLDPADFAPMVHTHDDRYYTETECNNKFVSKTELGQAGYGNMHTTIYDTDNDGKVDAAETADNALMLEGKDSSYFVQKNINDTITEALHQADGWHNNIASYSLNASPVHGLKIRTNLPVTTLMPLIKIEGYIYGVKAPIGLLINFYWWTTQLDFLNYGATSYGAVSPPIKLAVENGKIVIFLEMQPYYPRFSVSVFNLGFSIPNTAYEGWVVIDEAISDTATNIKTVPYQSNYMPKGPVSWDQLKGV